MQLDYPRGVTIASNSLHFPTFPQGERESHQAKVFFGVAPSIRLYKMYLEKQLIYQISR